MMSVLTEGSHIGPYRLVRKLGEGGMGMVFEAVHTAIERHVAIKVLHPEYAGRQDVVGRFFNEARAANLIDHPSIVQIADFGHTDEGAAYIVMEFLRGEALSARLRRTNISCTEAVDITCAIASALVVAHDKNIVHRDLKPDNVMLVPDRERPGSERLKLLDFGIAKLMEAEQAGQVKTRTNMVMGTPGYMSPEQCRGANRVDAQSDVYSLGIMFYEMLAGRLPFIANDSGSLIGMHLFMEPPPLREVAPHIPEPLASLVHQLLSKDKQRRPSMRDLAAQLQQLAGGGTVMPKLAGGFWLSSLLRTVLPRRANNSTLGLSAGQLEARTSRRSRSRYAVLAGGMASLLTIFGVFYLVRLARHPTHRPEARNASAPVTFVKPAAPFVSPKPAPVSMPRTIRWEISTDPPGAEVVRIIDGEIVGKTPLAHEQPAQPGQVMLTLRLTGYKPAQVTLDQETNGQIDKRLVPVAPRPSVTPLKARAQPTSPLSGTVTPPPSKSVETLHVPPRPKAEDLFEK